MKTNRTSILYAAFLLLAIVLLIVSGCSKENDNTLTAPILSTNVVTGITSTTALGGGNISDDGGAGITSRGICWSTASNPTLADSSGSDGSVGKGNYSCNLFGLTGNTRYYVRAWATNSAGTAYGDTISFTSAYASATTTTMDASNTDTISATLNGIVNANNLSVTITFEYGPDTDYGYSVTALQSPVTGNENTNVSADISGLSEGTTYHFRVRSDNSLGGTEYGSDLTFKTLGEVPDASAEEASNVISVAATLNGTVNANYLSTVVTFEYGTSINYDQTAAALQNPVTGSSASPISADITGLTIQETYHYRIKAVNSLGTTYSDDMTFATHYTLGESYFGGIIFYIDNTGEHGLVCAPEDQSSGIQWYNGSYVLTGATPTAIGTGQANTTAIVNVQGQGSYAAKICSDLVLNGFDDWFLPSKEELILMYNYVPHGDYGYAEYWSSSEGDMNEAWKLGIQTGGADSNYYNKMGAYPVRAARAF